MDDRNENFLSTALVVDQTLDASKPDWQHYGKLVADAGALKTALADVNTATQKLKAAEGAGGQIDVKDAAEMRALDAAMVIVYGAAASVEDAPNAVLAGVADWSRTELDELRDTDQVAQLEAIYAQAFPLKAELVDDLVTDAHFEELQKATAALGPLVGKAWGEVVTAASLRREEAKALATVRAVLKRLDKRMNVLSGQNKVLADRYFQARMTIDARGPGKGTADGK